MTEQRPGERRRLIIVVGVAGLIGWFSDDFTAWPGLGTWEWFALALGTCAFLVRTRLGYERLRRSLHRQERERSNRE